MASDRITHVNEGDFESTVLNSSVPVVVDFWATWCGPCKRIAPMLEAAASDLGDSVRITKVDVDQNRALAMKYGIQSIPTLLVFKDGQIAGKHIGALNRQQLDQLLARA